MRLKNVFKHKVLYNNMNKKDTHNYKGWLNSDNFWKRAFAIFGYSLIPMLIIYGILIVIGIIWIIIGNVAAS